eukprot:270328-Rhodomonas_salina.6
MEVCYPSPPPPPRFKPVSHAMSDTRHRKATDQTDIWVPGPVACPGSCPSASSATLQAASSSQRRASNALGRSGEGTWLRWRGRGWG